MTESLLRAFQQPEYLPHATQSGSDPGMESIVDEEGGKWLAVHEERAERSGPLPAL